MGGYFFGHLRRGGSALLVGSEVDTVDERRDPTDEKKKY